MKNLIFITFCLFSTVLLAQEQKRDTLFIKYDSSLLNRKYDSIEKTFFYIIKGTGVREELVYLLEKENYFNLKPKNVLCFKNVLKKSNSYFKSNPYYKKDQLDDTKLAEYLGKYVIFLIKGKKYIKVATVHESY